MNEKGCCKICGRFGHEEAVCYEVIGYPPGWVTHGCGRGSRGERNGKPSRGGNRAAGRGVFRAVASAILHEETENASSSGPGPVSKTAATTKDATRPKIPGLTADQVQQLFNLIDGPQPAYEKLLGKVLWMLDSGASCHMVGDKTMLSDVQKIAPMAIGLPNGEHTMAREMGLTSLGENLQLENVLYVPNLKCNLISISKLCK